MHTSRPAPVLVDDLIPVILESNDHWWPRDFQRLALISPAWVYPVRKRLYAHPSLRTYRSCHLLARTFAANPELVSFVHRLELRPTADEERALDEREMQSLRCILGLKGLRSLTLGGDLAVAAHRFLSVMHDTRAVTDLHIDGCMVAQRRAGSLAPVVPSLEWDDAIAFRFPNLRSLTLSNVLLTIVPSMMDRPAGLTHLTLDNVDVDVGFLPDICQGSWETLRELRLIRGNVVDIEDGVRSMLETCENLETLYCEGHELLYHVTVFDEDEPPPPCPNLRKLCLSGFDIHPGTLGAIAEACPAVEELAVLGRVVRVLPDQWTAFLSSGRLKSLRRLLPPPGTRVPPFEFWCPSEREQLHEVCNAKGISLADWAHKTSQSLVDW
ncbi:hypothetical protein C2E23DRAFT_154527 [Lenzites betulinus]|nr:hypothetical protein C2E23DRAFT_154527 [Lenzites betulinus]